MPAQYDRAVEVKIDGEVLSQDKYRIGNLRLHQPMYAHHEFELEVLGTQVLDGLAAQAENSDLDRLMGTIGAKFELKGGHDYMSSGRSEELSFAGIITSVEASTDLEYGFMIRLRGHSPTIKLDDVARNKVFKDMTASDWFSSVTGERGLSVQVESTNEVFPELVQRGVNDWNFALRLLGQAGLHLYYDGRELLAKKKVAGEVIPLGYARTEAALLEFAVVSTARPGKLKAYAWGEQDPKQTLQQSTASAKSNAKATHGFTKKAEAASGSLFSVEGNYEPAVAPGSQSLLDTDAGSARGAWISSLTHGRGRSDHFGLAPGKLVELSGFGADLNGKYVLTSVTHVWADDSLVYSNQFECIPEASISPPRELRNANQHEIWTARVTDLNDPLGFGRVLVQFLNFEEPQWARLASFYLNETGGFVCYPEIGDEVIVSFTDGDDRYPVIIGSVLHPKSLGEAQSLIAAGLSDQSNNFKVFRSRSGHLLLFDETPGAQKIELSTPAGEVLLRLDAAGGAEKLEIVTKGEVTITAEKTCTVTAKEDVTVNTDANATIKAKNDIVLEAGGNLTMKAKMKVALEGGTETEVKGASGSVKASPSGVDVKGPMIKLN